MYLDKEPAKTVQDQKAKKALDKEPPEAAKAKKKEEMKAAGGFAAQTKVVAAREPPKPGQVAAPQKDPVADLKKLFREMDLPDKLVPENVADFSFDPGSGALVIQLKNAFSRQFDAENTVTFDKTISGTLQKGSFNGLTGIRRGSATIVSIERTKAGVIGIRGKLGPFSKMIEFKDEQIPTLP